MTAVLLAVLSTVIYALAALQQRRAAAAAPRLAGQLRRPVWWLAVGLLGTGAGLHAAALTFGPLTLVQPLGALTLVFAVPLAAYTERRVPTPREWLGVAAAVCGLAGLLALIRPAGPARVLDGGNTALVAAFALVLLATVWLAGRSAGRAQGTWLACGAGVSSAVASSCTQTVLVASRWQQAIPALAALVIFVLIGLLLSQLSYRQGLSAPLAAATITNPVAATSLGVLVLGEQVTSGIAAITLGVIAAGVAAVGVVQLTRTGAATIAHT
jgi:drug/metabolite transporter (DMT)-like permease